MPPREEARVAQPNQYSQTVSIDTANTTTWTNSQEQLEEAASAIDQMRVSYEQLSRSIPSKPKKFRPDPGPFDFGVLSDVLQFGVPLNAVNKDLEKAVRHLQLLERSGMHVAAHQLRQKYEMEIRTKAVKKGKYVTITDKKVQKYLDGMAIRYNKHYDGTKTNESDTLGFAIGSSTIGIATEEKLIVRPTQYIDSNTQWRNSTDPKRVGIFRWEEVDSQAYQGIPPVGVLEKLQTEKKKKIFNYFTIANVKHIPDPILFGRIDGCPDRFYLAQWGDDVCLDDLI